MKRFPQLAMFVLAIAFLAGCEFGSSDPPAANINSADASPTAGGGSGQQTTLARPKEPAAAVTAFLHALRNGDDQQASNLLTNKAREETAKHGWTVSPPGSNTAQFTVGEVEYVTEAKDGAHVLSNWTDAEQGGDLVTYEIVWILRLEQEGWGIAGMATRLFDDRLPLILNFEDPEDIMRKRQQVEEEMARMHEEEIRQAQQPPSPDETAIPR